MNITPALHLEDKKNLSAEEFQKQLCSWLESRGLLCELRAYFRSNMIEVLKNTSVGSSLACKVKQTISPKMQAMNLLISEYFIYSQYHFSLCVFCTEVSLNNMLQNVNCTSPDVIQEKPNFKFTEKQVYDILESMGILRYNQQAQKIYSSYCELDEPLITYFLPTTCLTGIEFDEPIAECMENLNDADCDGILGKIDNLLMNSNMLPSKATQLKQYIKLIYEKQHEKHNNIIESLKEEYRGQLKKYKVKLNDIQKVFDSERKTCQEEIVLMKQQLHELSLQNQMIKRSNEINNITKVVNQREKTQQTEVKLSDTSTCGHVCVHDKSTQCMTEIPPKLFKHDKEQQTLTNTSLESAVLKHVVEQMEKENNRLRIDNFNYCEQIDELANRASILMSELNISQQNVVRLNNLLQNTSHVFTMDNLVIHHSIPHYTGAGEEYSATTNRPQPSNYRHLNRPKKCPPVKKPPPSSSENSSSSVTPTDDLLQEAKTKLKNLEIESENIDRRMRSFTERYDFAPGVNQSNNPRSTGKSFNFTNDTGKRSKDVFTFGNDEFAKNYSNPDSGPTPYESMTSFPSTSISNDEDIQSRKEDGE
ncbi:hypothetical protein MML48_4g00004456 [Holotrichia oblita]|uniref:Uncharacterized protein n=1 Tax=Holotrichia oblita TaxID=644536 RepID=A0ACB9T6L7_HOLOL|nr:hypothetical protein MML48_4g00004456 [Holotrichia oblita]